MRISFFCLFLFFLNNGFSQECFPSDKKGKRLINKVQGLINGGAYYQAIDALQKRTEQEVIFNVLQSEILWKRGDFYKAEISLLRIINSCPSTFPKAYYFLGSIAFNRKDYINADIYLKMALNLQIKDPYYSDAMMLYENAKILANIINNPVIFDPKIVKYVSTDDDEYLPVISPDQELMFFTRRLEKESLQSITTNTIEEFVFSKKLNGFFEIGKPLNYPFNIESNEGGASITIDNNVLYFTKCIKQKNGYNNCDIFYTYNHDGTWSEVKAFSEDISKIDSWESQPTVSSDGKTIIFSSDRSGGYGKMDLYEINQINGQWSKPKNLGPTINSSEYEKSPYLHTDGRTLFFASTNFPSIGGFDIFYSKKDSSGNWQNPVNIGYPINTIANEISLFVSTDGNKAYFASNNLEGVGGWDIYSFDLHDGAKPERVLFLKGNVLDENQNEIDNIELEIKNINTQEVKTIKVKSGTYFSSLTLDESDDLIITVKKEGFAFNSFYISSEDSSFNSPSSLDFKMQLLEEGRSFNIQNINFKNNSYEIQYTTKQILIEFSKYLELNKALVIEINGFTDNIGDKLDNIVLSENRAKAVRSILLSQGISEERISYNGFGDAFPIANNNTQKGRAQNRRTEFKIISQ